MTEKSQESKPTWPVADRAADMERERQQKIEKLERDQKK